jgi:RNA polymerase sigma factor (sigma-70 family)
VTDGCEATLREFYAATYPRLVSVVALVIDSRAEAEDIAQEAFARLVPRWSAVSRHESLEAWVRTVAFRLASNRRRKIRNGLTATRRHGAPLDVAAPSADSVDVRRALAALPMPQRQVVVLHHLVGLELTQVAAELGIPTGTVKSRLSRSRAVLAPLLREQESSDA